MSGLLTPTEIVLTALRLVDPSIPSLELARFNKIAEANSDKLIRLMEPQDNLPSRFVQCLSLIYDALYYDEKTNDIGLPRLLLQSLRPRVWQTIAIWVNANFQKIKENVFPPIDRLNMIRFALFDFLNFFIERTNRLSSYINRPAFLTLPLEADLTRSRFPALKIFTLIKDKIERDHYPLRFMTPLSYNIWMNKDSTQTLPTYNQLSNERAILMYAQRYYLTQWEKLHLDIDHIVPSQWMVFRAGPLPETVFWKVKGISSYWRYEVLHRSGNYRYWPDSLNRAYHDMSPKDKFIHRQFGESTSPEHERIGLPTVRDILDASVISFEDAKEWEDLCTGNTKNWTGDRFASFKGLVTKRRYRMYKEMFEAMQWDEWIDAMNGN